jgi:pyridoxamine 5'-phosphate oxidase
MRMVILRDVDTKARTLLIYTDSRSDKYAELSALPFASLLFWNSRANWQLRIHARTSLVVEGEDWASRWQHVKQTRAAVDYQSALRPGAPLRTLDLSTPRPEDEPNPDTHFFALVQATVLTCDSLELRREGHRRAVFDYQEGTQEWLQP